MDEHFRYTHLNDKENDDINYVGACNKDVPSSWPPERGHDHHDDPQDRNGLCTS